MHWVIFWVVVSTCLLTVVVGLVHSLLNRRADRLLIGLVAFAGAAVVVQSVVACVEVVRGYHLRSLGSFLGYAVCIVFVLPFTVSWSREAEPRYRGAVMAIGSIAALVMTVRLMMIWHGRS